MTRDVQAALVEAADDRRFREESELLVREVDRAYATWDALDRTRPLSELSPAAAADVALVLAANRYVDVLQAMRDPVARRHRCGWCWRAGGGIDAVWATLPEMTPAEAGEHALTCEHNPLVQRLRAVERERDEARDEMRDQAQTIGRLRFAPDREVDQRKQLDRENTALIDQLFEQAVGRDVATVYARAGERRTTALVARCTTLSDEIAARDRALDACAARIAELLAEVRRLEGRRDALLALVASVSQSTPLAEELQGWEGQRAALIAEVGTLRAARTGRDAALGHVRRELRRLAEQHPDARPELEMLAVQIDVSIGCEEGDEPCAR